MGKSIQRKKRKTVSIEAESVQTLQDLLGADTPSRAVRIAVEDRLFAERIFAADERIMKRGGLADVYQRIKPGDRGK